MNNFNITDIEFLFKGLVARAGIVDKIYIDRPKSAVPQESFAVVRVTGTVSDLQCYGECEVGVHLFAKDILTEKNGKKLSWMYEKLIDAIPPKAGKYLIDTCPFVLPDVSDDYGFHARIVTFNVTISITE